MIWYVFSMAIGILALWMVIKLILIVIVILSEWVNEA